MSPGRTVEEQTIHPAAGSSTTAELLEKDSRYCSYGDTVHYADPPKIFARCDGSYLFDESGTPYLDLQMWYSAVNFGYKNRRLNDALKRQIDTLPQLAVSTCTPKRWSSPKRSARSWKTGSA